MSALAETINNGILFAEIFDVDNSDSVDAYLDAHQAVASLNIVSVQPEPEAMESFMELLRPADPEFLDVANYDVQETAPAPAVDWESVCAALEESQKTLILVQDMLTETLSGLNIPDYQFIRFQADQHGLLRVVGEHDRKFEIESVVNSAENGRLRDYFNSVSTGLSLAGGLVGSVAVPPELVDYAREQQYAAAC